MKQYKGDEAKIQARITEWWEEPAIVEPQWENVGKANKPKETSTTTTSNITSNSSIIKSSKPAAVGGAGERSDRGAARGEGRGRDSGRGGGFDRNSRGGGRGDGPRKDFGRGTGRGGGMSGRNGDRDRSRGGASSSAASTVTQTTSSSSTVDANEARELAEKVLKMANMECPSPSSGIPTPVSNVSAPKGVWGTGQSFASVAASTSAPKPKPPPVTVAPSAPAHVVQLPAPTNNANASVIEPEEEVPIDLGGPMPSGILSSSSASASSAPSANKPTGNVWGSKGGAHLIQAEKKPIPAPPRPPPPAQIPLAEPDEQEPEFSPEPEKQDSNFISLGSVLPPSMNGSNVNASGWDSVEKQQQQQSFVPSPVHAIPTQSIPVQEPVVLPTCQQAAPAAAPTKPNSVLNMGHWETGDGDDELDFGFGSYDNDTEETTMSHSSANASSAPSVPHASPSRPPPGLSMPPMPAGAMLVHELENKLEAAVLAPKNNDNNNNSGSSDQVNTQASSSQPQLFMNPPGMPQYGGMGMYGIPPPGMHNGLLSSMPPAQFGQLPLDSGLNQLNNSRPGNSPSQLNQAGQPLTQQGQYGMPSTTSASTNTGAPSSVDTPNGVGGAPGGMPPGMPPTMQGYPSPAYMYASGGVPGQFNQMGHPAYGMQAAPYGYGQQFAPQGQYGGYSQGLMGQGGGYGAPQHYDDQRGGPRGGNMRDEHQGGGYNKRDGGRGGYRGNRNQHQNNHPTGYGNNYGPANSNLGYGGMPQYGGYGHGGGYGNPGGPAGMDPYAMQQQQQQGGGGYGGGGGFNHQDNDHSKKSLGGVSNHQQAGGFQSHLHPQQSHLHQQQSGLHAGSSNDVGGVGQVSGSGGWPGARQQQWSGDWQQDN